MGGYSRTMKAAATMTAILMLTACEGMQQRLSEINKPPVMSGINNPYTEKGYKPVSLPMPPQQALNTNANSLWQSGRQTFFKDQRANKVGDILTILITVADEATMKNKTERTRDGSENQGLSNFFGLEKLAASKLLPDAADPTKLVGMNSASTSLGDGKITRTEDIKLKLAAMVTQVLPNGNFVLRGSQEMRVNTELRQLTITGVIRPEDILNNNTLSYEKIAEARISYGGRGEMSDIQQPRYGEQVFDAVFPF